VGTHYETLGVSPHAEDVVIEAAYKAMMKRHHPDAPDRDVRKGDAQAKAINGAYRILRNPETRTRYDRDLANGAEPPPGRARAEEAEPVRPSPASAPSKPAKSGGLISIGFIGLALAVIVSAFGSLIANRSSSTTEAAASTAPASDTAASEAPAKTPASTPPSLQEPRETVSDAAPAPIAEEVPKPSFDCARADTDVLRLVCAAPDLARADADMAAAYREAVNKSADPGAVRADQRQWLTLRDRTPADQQALIQIYAQRISQLRNGASMDLPPF
jgi:curved DNA-binding protein CbpA